jgi:hypothetical protein
MGQKHHHQFFPLEHCHFAALNQEAHRVGLRELTMKFADWLGDTVPPKSPIALTFSHHRKKNS